MSRIGKCLVAVLAVALLQLSLGGTAGCITSRPKWRLQAVESLPRTADFYGVWGSSSSDAFVVGLDGVVLHYDGKVWSEMESGTTEPLHGVWGSSPADVFAVGESGTILHYNGADWSPMKNPGVSTDLFAVWGSSQSDIYAVGELGTALHYDGSKWASRETGALKAAFSAVWGSTFPSPGVIIPGQVQGGGAFLVSFYGVWGSSVSDVFVVGRGATGPKASDVASLIMHYNGTTWSPKTLPSGISMGEVLYGVWGSSASKVYAVGQSSSIAEYDGQTWSAYEGNLYSQAAYWVFPPSLNAVWGSSDRDAFAVGDSGIVLHGNGKEWKTMTSPAKVTLNGVWGSSSSDVFAVGKAGTILHYSR